MNSRQKRYDLALKHEICSLYTHGGYTKVQLQTRYDITGKSTLLMWLRQLGYIEPKQKSKLLIPLSLPAQDSESKEIKALKAKLLDAELKAEAYQRMIAIAEKKYKIEIEKKNDTK
jgi:transposase-like protein